MAGRRRIPEVEFATERVSQGAARRLFVRAINKVTPEVYEALLNDVVPVWISEDPFFLGPNPEFSPDGGAKLNAIPKIPDELTATLKKWASTFHLEFDWFLGATTGALVGGVIGRKSADLLTPELWEKSFGLLVAESLFEAPVFKLRWDPQVPDWWLEHKDEETEDENEVLVVGTRKQADAATREAVRGYLDRVERSALDAGLLRTEEKRGDKGGILGHFEWLALRLIREESWYGMEKTLKKSRQTIKGGVRSACVLTGIPVKAVSLPSE